MVFDFFCFFKYFDYDYICYCVGFDCELSIGFVKVLLDYFFYFKCIFGCSCSLFGVVCILVLYWVC